MRTILVFVLSLLLLHFGNPTAAFAADNLIQSASLRIRAAKINPAKRRRKINARRNRLKDGSLTNVLKGGVKKTVIKITFPTAVRLNTLRLLAKRAFSYNNFILKNGENKSVLFRTGKGIAAADGWIVLNGFNVTTSKLTLIIRTRRRPAIKELQAFDLRSDFNGDGFNDLLGGAPLHDGGGANFGRAFVFLGGPSFDDTPDLFIDGDEGAQFSRSLVPVGDVNGDGFSDFLISAYLHNAGVGTNRGRVWLHLGGSTLDTIPDLEFSGDEDFSGFGRAVAAAGDLNADGFADFIIGAPFHSGGGTGRGTVYVYLGSANPDTVADLTVSGSENGASFGSSVTGGKDLNGDGFDDYAVGANQQPDGMETPGAAFLFLGGASLSSTPAQTFPGDEDMGQHGDAVQFPGDVNGDGFQDFTVGASMHDAGGPVDENQGRVYLYLGSASIDATADVLFDGTEVDGGLGLTLPHIGDVNRDGFAEVAAGAPFMDLNGGSMADYGRLYIYNGAASGPSTTASQTIDGTEDQANVGLTAQRLDLFPLEGQDICVSGTGLSTGSFTDNGAVLVYQYDAGAANAPYTFDSTQRDTIAGDEDSAFFGNVDQNPS